MAMLNMVGYLKIAGVLQNAHEEAAGFVPPAQGIVELVVVRLADLFERDSTTFDRQWFYYEIGISIPTEEDQNGKRTG